MKRHRFDREGVLALEPRAATCWFDEPATPSNKLAGEATIVTIRGPLQQHAGYWFDSYEAIAERFMAALAAPAPSIVLAIDCPGGDVRGCFELAREMRARAAAAGKRLLAHVDGVACSGGYAIASAAERIVAAPSASVGSIGVIATRVDATAADEKWGVAVAVVTSGVRKAYGHPSTTISEAELTDLQRTVDTYAGTFFELVAEHRGLDAAVLKAMEAGVFGAAEAAQLRLIDAVGSLETLLAPASEEPAAAAAEEGKTMSKARKALQAIIDDEKASDEDKDEARKALAAMDDDSDKDDSEESKAEGDEGGEDEDKKKDEEAKALAAKDVDAKIEAAFRARDEAAERAQLLASRPDLDAPTKALLATAPIAQVRDFVKEAPRKALKPAATAVVGATRAEGQGEPTQRSDQSKTLAVLMGRAEEERAPRFEGKRQVFPVMNRAQRVKYLEARTKAAQAS